MIYNNRISWDCRINFTLPDEFGAPCCIG